MGEAVQGAFAFYRDRFADAGDFTFVLVGNFDVDGVEPLVRTWLGSLPTEGRVESWRDLGIRPPDGTTRFEVRRGLEDKSQVRIAFTGEAAWSREEDHRVDALAQVLRTRLREELGRVNAGPDRPYALGFSIGVIVCQADETRSVTYLLTAADARMYAEKRQRREGRAISA